MSITALINAGYVAADILDVLSKKNPAAGRKIRKVLSLGYPAASVLKFLTGDKGSNDDAYLTREEQSKKNVESQRKKALIGAGIGSAALLGGAGLLAARTGAGGIAQAAAAVGVPNVPPNPPAGGVSAQASGLSKNAILQQAAQMPSPTTKHGAIQTGQQTGLPVIQPPPVEFDYSQTKFAKNYPQITKFVEKHKEVGKSEDETYESIKQSKLFGPIVNKFEEETKAPFSEAIKQIYDKDSKEATRQTSDIVITPFGAGNIHKEHGKDAYVEVDDKLRKIPKEELQPPDPDVVEAVNNILKIPEIDRSSNVALFLYDPTESKAIFQFHDGSAYKYLDIDPEIVRRIAAKDATPITEGKNMYGAWSPDDPHGSIGAALWAYVLKDPKYAKTRKGEPANPNYMKLETLYDYWEKLRKKRGKK